MNQQRRDAELQIVQSLLNCPNGEELAILTANSELIDAGLVETMEGVAADLVQQGDENAAWLKNLASQLAVALGNSTAIVNPENASLRFLLEVLQATSDSDVNPHVVYPLLSANLDKLNDNFAQLLLY